MAYMETKLKFAGALKGRTMVIKDVQFVKGEATVGGPDTYVPALCRYLAAWQALPVDEADALQAEIDSSSDGIEEAQAALASAKEAQASAEAELSAMREKFSAASPAPEADKEKPAMPSQAQNKKQKAKRQG